MVTSKKWLNRGGGRGFGWKTMKVRKYKCELSNQDVVSNILPSDENLSRVAGRQDTRSGVGEGESFSSHVAGHVTTNLGMK